MSFNCIPNFNITKTNLKPLNKFANNAGIASIFLPIVSKNLRYAPHVGLAFFGGVVGLNAYKQWKMKKESEIPRNIHP
jgi:hypothetical protein